MGLLDTLNSPAGIGLLSAIAGGMSGARRGQPVNSIGRGLVGGLTGYAQANDQIKQDQDNALEKQYKQLKMDEMQRKMEQAKAQQTWKAGLPQMMDKAQTKVTPFQPDDPFNQGPSAFGEMYGGDQHGQQTDALMANVQQGDPQALQQYLMQPDSPYADKLMEQQYFPDREGRTAEQKNFEYAQTLPPEQREMFMARAGGGSAPATVQEWEYFSKLDPQAQGRFLEMKRNPQIMNLGGSQAVRAPGGGISENYAVTPKITETPEFQAAQEAAKVGARETVQRGAEAASNLPKVQASATNARNMVQGVLDHPGFSSTVGVTALPGARFVPGTKEADFMSRMDQLKGSAFLQAFETLKGGGQITEVEGKKATDAINRMSISTSENEFRQAAQDFLSVVDRAGQNATRAAGTTSATPQEQTYIQQRRSQGVPDAQIAKEMNKATKPQAQAQPMPAKPSAMTLKKGVVYETPKGALRWNGKAFEDAR